MEEAERARYLEYRREVEQERLPPALRGAILIFAILQTIVFVPADWILHPEHFEFFLIGRMAMNAALFVIYFATPRWPVLSSMLVCALGTALFMFMIENTGGVTSGYYAGMILLVVGMGVLTPQTAKHSALIAVMMFGAYLSLPLYSGHPFEPRLFAQNLVFLAAACAEAYWASLHMDRMRFRDFKQKREIEEARDALAELDQAKSRFSSNVHHELRTPLTLILAPLDAIRSGDFGAVPESFRETLATMHSNGQRLYKMINNLLDLTKIESHQFKIVRRPTQIADMVKRLVGESQPLADGKGIALSMQGLDDLPEVNLDPEAADKVLVNLVGNALKFTPRGGSIQVSAECREAGVAISVEDTGAGIAADKLGQIFDRFAQVDGSTTRRHEGTGIGLALAREMVELHGGEIEAFSPGLGHGTRFCAFFPWGVPDALSEEMVLTDDRGQTHGLGLGVGALSSELGLEDDLEDSDRLGEVRRHIDRLDSGSAVMDRPEDSVDDPRAEILIAEDNPDMRALLSRLVGREFRVRVARNGKEALQSLREKAPDLVLSDVMMPEMSGTELCQAIKSDLSTRSIPVVLVTSKAEREMKIEGLEIGADDYVTKPFHPRELMARVRSLVRVGELQNQLRSRNQELESALMEVKLAEVQLVQSERLAAVGELAAGIAHEVNNPVNFALNAVRTMESTVEALRELAEEVSGMDSSNPTDLAQRVEAFQKKSEGETARELAADLSELSVIVADGLKRTSSLVGDLREFARPGRQSEMSEGVDLEVGMRSTMKLVSHSLQAAHAEIQLEVESGLPRLFADAGALNQVFLNLIKNSAESFDGDSGQIVVRLQHNEREVVVEVQDDGEGIPEEIQPSLFEPFFTTKEKMGGTGLGLSISRGIVIAHGGRIEVVSRKGEGTTFRIFLPLENPTSQTDAESMSAA